MLILLGVLFMITVSMVWWVKMTTFIGWDQLILSNNYFCNEFGISANDFVCVGMLFFCGFIALLFSLHYFGWAESNLNILIVSFLGVMVCLIASDDYLLSLFWWEYLGVVSLFLILYYSNFDTLFAGNSTIVASRVGDVGFFLLVCYFVSGIKMAWLGLVSVCVILITKSAVVPFCSWLLEAMRAPTPVSCLVHSSTLVAAGVWFLSSYGCFLLCNNTINFLMWICLLTIFVSGFAASVFTDIKKIVALSTCNNISWCFVYYLSGSPELCICQLVCHGIGKCMLFIVIGDSLASAGGSQNKSCFTALPNNSLAGFSALSLLSISVAGFPFLGVFFTKHAMLNGVFNGSGFLVTGLVLIGAFVSYTYSMRLIFLVTCPKGVNNQWLNNVYLFLSPIIVICSLFGYSLAVGLEETSEINSFYGVFILLLNFAGVLVGYGLYSFESTSVYYASFGYFDDVVMSILNDFSIVGFIQSVLFNFRSEVYVVKVLGHMPSISFLRVISIPVSIVIVMFVWLW
uniref:NADH:ubiquinone reductase (H(+)-translocating) n=1 Tax=Cichlidogyrus sclerosus TaxID=341068 RepID=A0A3G0WMN3_9PLAT|nr:NADH dehydrogenase subunit 5 [Cichlidogyrus sclerosus]